MAFSAPLKGNLTRFYVGKMARPAGECTLRGKGFNHRNLFGVMGRQECLLFLTAIWLKTSIDAEAIMSTRRLMDETVPHSRKCVPSWQ